MSSYKEDASHESVEKEPSPQEINMLVTLFNQKRYAEMETLARELAERFPGHGIGWKAMGTALLQQGRNEEAIAPLQRAAELSQGDAQPHNNLGNTLLKLNRLPEAEASLRRALELKPDYAGAHYNLGEALNRQGRLPEAETAYRRVLELKPDYAEAHCNLGDILFGLGRLPEAEAGYRRELEFYPGNAKAHSHLGVALNGQGKFSEAEASYRRAIELKPGFAGAHNNLGNTLRELNRPAEAEASYRRALKLTPEYAEAYRNLGLALNDQGRYAEAEASCRQALALKPDMAGTHSCLGLALLKLGRLDEAEASCRRALALKPGFAEAQSILDDIMREQGLLPDYLAPEVFDFANGRLLRRYFPRESSTFIYNIDISGTCNLRCPACPVGNFPDANRTKGFMDLDLFRSIVEKIKQDRVGDNPKVWLFIWGEPMLHPKLAEMISILKQNGLYVMISTNLNIKKNLEEVIRSGPDEIKISLSGFTQEFYSKTHVKGNIELVKENMNLIRDFMNNFNVSIKVWVGHHLYRHNRHESVAIENLCRALGFRYAPIQAFYMPLEKMMDLIEGKTPASENDLLANFMVHPLDDVARKRNFINPDLDCELRFNMHAINYDGSVALCCGVYDHQLGVNFVNTSHDEIQSLKYRHPFCKKCYDYGLQYSKPNINPGGSLEHHRIEIQGEFLMDSIGNPFKTGVLWSNGQSGFRHGNLSNKPQHNFYYTHYRRSWF